MKQGTFDVFLIGGLIFAVCLFFVVFILAAPNIAEKDRIEHTCPYGDVQGLDKYGGVVVYSVGSEEHSATVSKGYHRAIYWKSSDTLKIYHNIRVPVGTWNHVSYINEEVVDLHINGWQIKEIIVHH